MTREKIKVVLHMSTADMGEYGELLYFCRHCVLEKLREGYETLSIEPYLVKYIQENGSADKTFIDIGSEYGYFTRIAAKHFGQVYAYEAHPVRAGVTRWNILDLPNARVENAFIGSEREVAFACEHVMGLVGQGPPAVEANGNRDVSLDAQVSYLTPELILPKGECVVKVDIEGNEINLFKPDSPCLDRTDVIWIVELHPMYVDVQPFLKLMEARGFTSEPICPGRPNGTGTLVFSK